jgi:hypothetical protein
MEEEREKIEKERDKGDRQTDRDIGIEKETYKRDQKRKNCLRKKENQTGRAKEKKRARF